MQVSEYEDGMETEKCVAPGFYIEHRMGSNCNTTFETEVEVMCLGESSIDFRFGPTDLDKLVGPKLHIKLDQTRIRSLDMKVKRDKC